MTENSQNEVIHFSQERDFWGNLKRDLQELRGISTLVYELIQNADDVKKPDGKPNGASRVKFNVRDDCLIVENDGVFSDCSHLDNNECPWKFTSRGHRCDFHRMKQVGGGDKRNQSDNTGAFGIGFNAVYQITDHPEIISSGWHWKLFPEYERDYRISAKKVPNINGTKFVLPWAFDPESRVRQELRGCPAIQPEQIEVFEQEIRSALPKAAIFLKQIASLELLRNGHPVLSIEREEKNETKELVLLVNGEKTTWKVFRDDFASEAKALRQRYGQAIEVTRRSTIAIAVPDSPNVQCFIFADLPTETPTHLPFHIEADFYPTSDRKRILMDDSISSDWNRQAIRSAANLIQNVFPEIMKLFPAVELWDWIAQVYKGSKESPIDTAFTDFWENLCRVLPVKAVLLTSKNDKTYLNRARLLESDEEIYATKIWEDLDIHVVHSDLRKYYNLLQELGTPRLKLEDITRGLTTKGYTSSISLKQSVPSLRTIEGFKGLWQAINQIWNSKTRSSQEERSKTYYDFANCAIAFAQDNQLYPLKDMYKGEAIEQKIFSNLVWYKDYSNSDPIPSILINDFNIQKAIEELKIQPIESLWLQGKFLLKDLYHWLESQREQISNNSNAYNNLRSLPIWPAGGQLKPLTDLYLPGGFDDPLKLASVLDVDAIGGRSEFLQDVLKVKLLDFPTYIREKVSQAFKNIDSQPPSVRIQLVDLLARRQGEIRDYVDIQYILKNLPLIECKDNAFYPATMVYFDNDVNRVLGPGVRFAKLPKTNVSAVEQFYEWLGVSKQPRDEDILARIISLTGQSTNESSLHAIETIFVYLGQQWKQLSSQHDTIERRNFERNFEPLKRQRWLPGSRNPGQWFSPDTLHVSFNKILFASQGNFLEFAVPIQQNASEFIEFLDVQKFPLPIHMVRHILYCSDNNTKVSWEVYRYLNSKDSLADERALQELIGKNCIQVCEEPAKYVRPDQIFWIDHPFGPYRYQLGAGIRAYENLLKYLGVRTSPEPSDYIQVLLDIGQQFRTTPIDEDTHIIVMNCWRKLSDFLANNELSAEDLKLHLSNQRVIPSPRSIMTAPEKLFFEDRAGLASRFEILKNHIIQRTEGCWLAMEAVGVLLLSRMIVTDLAKQVDTEPDEKMFGLIQERKLLIQRIIDAEQKPGEELPGKEKLLALNFQKADDLEIIMSIRVFNSSSMTEPELTNALLKDDVFYTVWKNGSPSWAAVGRELALALKPSGEISGLAMGLKEVLSAFSYREASTSLDELNYPPLLESLPANEFPSGPTVDIPIGDPLADIFGGDVPDRPYAPFVPEDPDLPGGGNHRPGRSKHTRKRRSSMIISYVYPEDANLPPDQMSEPKKTKREETEKAGVSLVIEDEDRFHRDAIDMNVNNPNHEGYDLTSTDRQSGIVRLIEVKAISGVWDSSNPIKMTKNEFETAQIEKEKYWLYIVERATSEDFQIYRIQNPANRAQFYVYDHGWEPLSQEG